MNKIESSIVSVMGREWLAASPISSSLVSVACFVWFIVELDDPFPLAACVAMACKAIFDLSVARQ